MRRERETNFILCYEFIILMEKPAILLSYISLNCLCFILLFNFFFLSRPYMTIGSLRDQVIYPNTRLEMQQKGFTDAKLNEILRIVHLEHIIEREGGMCDFLGI